MPFLTQLSSVKLAQVPVKRTSEFTRLEGSFVPSYLLFS
jgi:hypothetical protein